MESGTPLWLSAVWGTSGSDVFAAGYNGLILHYDGRLFHYDGNQWRNHLSPTEETIRGIWGDGVGNLFAVGEEGLIHHYNGVNWRNLSPPVSR